MQVHPPWIAVIGGGPAGLMFAHVFRQLREDVRVTVYEMGGPLDPTAFSIQGLGGAGIFIDGKISLPPAGTPAYRLRHSRQGYDQVRNVLSMHGVDVGPFPVTIDGAFVPSVTGWDRKIYPSFYIPIENRIRLMDTLVRGVDVHLHSDVHLTYMPNTGIPTLCVNGESVFPTHVVFACGRFGPLWYDGPSVFRRVEFGVRLQYPCAVQSCQFMGNTDPKIQLKRDGFAARTFCYCRHGYVENTVFRAPAHRAPDVPSMIVSASGHSDGPPSVYVNHGILVRYAQARSIPWCGHPFSMTFTEFAHSPPAGYEDVAYAARMFVASYGIPPHEVTVHGPCIEGVANYPNVDVNTLQVVGAINTWAIGDSSGISRGLMPAYVQGASTAYAIADVLKDE